MRYRDLFAEKEFTALYVADVFSISGSYLARVAVAALVYARTGSPALTAVAFAISFAPYLFSPWLSTLADLFPRRRLLVLCDLARAACVAVIVIPGLPLGVVLTFLFLEALFRVPWGAARLALLSDILNHDKFPAGNALVSGTRQALQVAGFAIGGVIVAFVGPRPTLAIDAVTFVISAVLIAMFVRVRPAPWLAAEQSRLAEHDLADGLRIGDDPPLPLRRPAAWASTLEGLRVVATTPRMRSLLLLLGLGPAVVVITEGLAVPFADELGGGVTLAGFIMAAPPLGNVVGLFFFGRLVFDRQQRLVTPLAIGGVLAVIVAALLSMLPGPAVFTVAALVAAGACLSYLSAIQSEISVLVAPELRGRVFGLANAVLQIAQGLAIVLAGLVASSTAVAPALIAMSAIGLAALVAVVSRMPAVAPVAADAPAERTEDSVEEQPGR